MVLTAAYCSLGGGIGTIHDHAKKIELAIQVEDKDVTTYASLGWKERLGGLKDGTLSLGLWNDIAASGLDQNMWANLGTVIGYEVRLTQSARSTANPAYTGNVLMKEWKPIQGNVGDVAAADVSWPTTAAVTRQTS
jgi:hypothetical protein